MYAKLLDLHERIEGQQGRISSLTDSWARERAEFEQKIASLLSAEGCVKSGVFCFLGCRKPLHVLVVIDVHARQAGGGSAKSCAG